MDGYSVISLLTLFVTALLLWKIRKDKDYKYSTLDTSSMILNTVLIVMVYPPLCVAAALMELNGFNSDTVGKILLATVTAMGGLMPAACVACIGASVILRRKERPVLSFFVQFAGALWFGIIVLLTLLGK